MTINLPNVNEVDLTSDSTAAIQTAVKQVLSVIAPVDTITVGSVNKVTATAAVLTRKKSYNEIIEMAMLMNSKTNSHLLDNESRRIERFETISNGENTLSGTQIRLLASSTVSVQVSMILEALFDATITSAADVQTEVETQVTSTTFVDNLKTANPTVFSSLTTPSVTTTVSTILLSTHSPTLQPTVFSTPVAPYSSKNILTVGLVCGLCGAVILLIVIGLNFLKDRKDPTSSSLWNNIISFVAVFMAIITTALVSAWAKNPDYSGTEETYLGQPDWDLNVFVWHPVLMVAGFFFSQVRIVKTFRQHFHSYRSEKLRNHQYHLHIVLQIGSCGAIMEYLS